MKRNLVLFAPVLLLAHAACAPEPASVIVSRAEAAGAGKLDGATLESMAAWLAKNRDVAREIDKMCAANRTNATAAWAETTEGRLCAAARSRAFFNSAPAKGDGKAYAPGTR